MNASRRRFNVFRGSHLLLHLCIEEHTLMSFCRGKFTKALAGAAVAVMALGITSGAGAVERSLAGIALGAKANMILKKYGNPTRITVGTVSAAVSAPGQPGIQPMPGNHYMPPAPMEGMAGAGDAFNPYGTGPYSPPPAGGLPSLPGLGAPGMMPMPGGPNTGQAQVVTQQEVTWTYEFTKGNSAGDTVEFIISEGGIVTQITVGGAVPWIASKTASGIKLGDDYKQVLFKYGYPEGHAYAGKFLRVSYVDKHRCMFTILNKKVVGITIALPE